MGIRPTFYLIIGVPFDELDKETMYTELDPEWLEDILYCRDLTSDEYFKPNGENIDEHWAVDLKIPGFHTNLDNWLYNAEFSTEYNADVIGLIRDRGDHDSDFIRALACLDKKYQSTGWEAIPVYKKEEHQWTFKYYGYDDTDIECNRFVASVLENMPKLAREQWKRAQHYLSLIGWDIPENLFRYILVWEWS